MRHKDVFLDKRYRRMIPIYMEQVFSITWAIAWFSLFIISIIQISIGIHPHNLYSLLISQTQYLSLICLIQFLVAMSLDRKYDEDLLKYYLYAIWYPMIYWYVNALVILVAIPKALFRDKTKFATWESPDRGIIG